MTLLLQTFIERTAMQCPCCRKRRQYNHPDKPLRHKKTCPTQKLTPTDIIMKAQHILPRRTNAIDPWG